MDKPILYLFSGLGADRRMFQRLDLSGFEVVHIQWIPPLADEPIDAYAARLLDQIRTPRPVLVGLSFGGMMAVEVAKLVATEQVILISSAKTRREIPFYYRWAGRLGLHRLVPVRLLKSANFLTFQLFGAHTPADKQLLRQVLHDTDPVFLRWAIEKIVNWTNTDLPDKFRHLHGSSDRILPVRFIVGAQEIEGGSHLMILDRADAVSRFLSA